jgi:hypothetical protein
MANSTSAAPALIVLALGLASLTFSVHGLMVSNPPGGVLGIVGGLAGYLLAWIIGLKAFMS